MPTPPKTAAPLIGVCTAKASRSSRICAASSRVGVSTRARVVPRGLSEQLVQDRQQEGGGLAAAGGGAGQHVAAGEGRADGIGLNGGRTREPEVLEGAREAGMQPEVCERHTTVYGNREPGTGMPGTGLTGAIDRAYGLRPCA